jgi:uncharacterized DUF497 family protein
MKFDWDAGKAATNRRKHGISFEEAEDMFAAAAIFEDFSHSEHEPRYLAIGFSAKGRMLTVVFTRQDVGVYRIISARKATKQEHKRYGQAKR